jgi:hypothetical protein
MALDGSEYFGLSATRPSRGRSRIEDDVSPSFFHIRIPHDFPANVNIGAEKKRVVNNVSRTCQELVKKRLPDNQSNWEEFKIDCAQIVLT